MLSHQRLVRPSDESPALVCYATLPVWAVAGEKGQLRGGKRPIFVGDLRMTSFFQEIPLAPEASLSAPGSSTPLVASRQSWRPSIDESAGPLQIWQTDIRSDGPFPSEILEAA